jgi:hypothetical protein
VFDELTCSRCMISFGFRQAKANHIKRNTNMDIKIYEQIENIRDLINNSKMKIKEELNNEYKEDNKINIRIIFQDI